MTKRSWARSLFARRVTRTLRKVPRRRRPLLEALEERSVPAVITPTVNPLLGPAGSHVEFRQANFNLNDSIAQADLLFGLPVSDPGVNAQAFDNGVGVINYLDTGTNDFPNPRDVSSAGNAYGGGSLALTTKGSFNGPAAEDDNFAMKSAGYLFIPQAGTWSFTVASDDGFQLTMGDNNATVAEYDGGRGISPTSGTAFVTSPGYYHYQLTWFQGGGAAACDFSYTGPGMTSSLLVGDSSGPIQVYQAPFQTVTPAPAGVGVDPGNQVEFRQAGYNLNDQLDQADNLFLLRPAWGKPHILEL